MLQLEVSCSRIQKQINWIKYECLLPCHSLMGGKKANSDPTEKLRELGSNTVKYALSLILPYQPITDIPDSNITKCFAA